MTLPRAALIFLVLYSALFAFAGFFATADPAAIDASLPYLPPEGIRFTSPAGQFHLRPYLVRPQPVPGQFAVYTRRGAAFIPLKFFVTTASADTTVDASPGSLHLCGISGGAPHFLGTDEFGRDVWSRLLYGGRTTLAIGLTASLAASLLALAVGLIAGSAAPWLDTLLMRLVETMISVPWFYLLLAVRALLPLRVSPWVAVAASTALMAAIGWARPARILRGVTIATHRRAYVTMARATGASPWQIARWHTLPDLAPQAITQFTVLLPQFIASEVALSYLGLGVTEPLVSWGVMLTAAQHLSTFVEYPWLISPIWTMIPFFFSVHVLADRAGSLRPLTLPSLSRHWYKLPR